MRQYLLPETGKFYKANLHAHTNRSDAQNEPEEVKQYFKELGYSVVAYTDHDIMLDHSDLCDEEFVALNGAEYDANGKRWPVWANLECCHFNMIALEPDNLKMVCWHRTDYLYANAPKYRDQVQFYEEEPDYIREYTGECISDMMKKGREHGFFVVYNHPIGSLENYTHYTNYHHMHALELYNYGGGLNEYCPMVYDDMLRAGEKIYVVGGDDSHSKSDCGHAWTMIKAEKLEYRSITDALVKGNFYASQGPEIYELYVEDNVMHITTSDAVKIVFTPANRRWGLNLPTEGEKYINHASYQLHDDNLYVRVTVTDEWGRTASTNAYFIDDIMQK